MNLQFPFIEASNGPDFSAEAKLIAAGFQHVAGVDEVGRGPLAGPVVAAAVILDPEAIPDGLDDSKKLTEKRREALFAAILPTARAVAWQAFNAAAIDRLNILEASMRAMARAVDALPLDCDHALVDGNRIPQGLAGRATALVKGDGRSLSIAAASIVAKVVRDRMMARACNAYPAYGFSGHKGYGARRHLDAIAAHGPCPLHRMSFAPLKG